MKRLMILTGMAAVAGWLAAGCDKPVSPVAKRQPHSRTNRVARAAAPKARPVRPAKETGPGTIYQLDAKNGFRNVTFGQPASKMANLVETSRDESRQLKTCIRSGETMSLHGVPLERVEYKFFRDELYAVQIEWKVPHPESGLSRPPTTELPVRCASEYGAPRRHRLTQDGTEYVWRGRWVELGLTELLLPGVADLVKGGWAIPPTTAGCMIIRNVGLSRAAAAGLTAKPGQGSEDF